MKCIFKTLLIIALYELSKEVAYEIIIRKKENDIVNNTPMDYKIDGWKRY
ncbi:MAG: hypothetical protein L0L52_10440 [Staphylococcus equorum]|nr:hypothetical protein [Staphylococcus equorum]